MVLSKTGLDDSSSALERVQTVHERVHNGLS
jgi:hypothetical protein